MTTPTIPGLEELKVLADHHERQGIFHAKAAASKATWYHEQERDTRRAAEHFAVASALRTTLTKGGDNGQG